jgi:PAS domain S-box-containing protein
MIGRRFLSYVAPLMAVAVMLLVILSYQGHRWRLDNEPLHSTTEAVEALSVLLLALFLLGRKREGTEKLTLPAVGFLGMGIINGFHAASWPGEEFVLLRAMASLIGGFGFVFVWLPAANRYAARIKWLPWAVAAGSMAFGCLTFLYAGTLPIMVSNEQFTLSAVAINLAGGIFFMAGACRLMLDFNHSGESEDYLFFLIGLFFGLAGLTFKYSALWSAEWWFWHSLRLVASLLVLVFLARKHMQTFGKLEISISGLKRAEESLKDSESRFRGIASAAPDAVILMDNDGNVSFWNDAATRMFGYRNEEIIGKYLHSLIMPQRYIDSYSKGFEVFRSIGEGPLVGKVYEIEAKRKDGTEFPVELSLAALKLKGKWTAIGIVRDITDRKLTGESLRQAMEELARSNEDLEQFANVVSHDLQAPLRSVWGFAEILADNYRGRLDKEADKFIDLIINGARRMQRMIHDILAYSRIGTRGGEFRAIDVEDVLIQTMENLHAEVEEKSAVITHDPLPTLRGDQSQIMLLFQNLLVNAIKFAVGAPRVHVSAGRKGSEWVFSVQDDGIGINPEHKDRIFTLFQRLHTETEYPGTGVGLAICKKIVERHGGRIWVESREGEGSTFYFTIPGKPGGGTDGPEGGAAE